MPSAAFQEHLLVLLEDSDELNDAHFELRTGAPGRQWGLGAINRAVVVMCVSAWEAYIEQVVIEAINAIRPVPPAALGAWPTINASARSAIGRFNNPNVENVRMLFSDSIGLANITTFWSWRNCTIEHARELLAEALRLRHEIAHGVNPRPVIHNPYARWLPSFFRRLGSRTDFGIRDYLQNTMGVVPWPA
jgi:RiboL-PSP-HEPN